MSRALNPPTPPGLAALVGPAYAWLCRARREAHANHAVWHLRWNWPTRQPIVQENLRCGRHRLSPVRVVATPEGERLECWEPEDALVLKAAALALEERLLPQLSASCYHLRGRGGVKGAVQQTAHLLRSGTYRFVARSDAKGYYANIHHTRLLELLRRHCRDPILLDLVSQSCGRTLEKDGYYRSQTKGISLGCPLSPLMGALYLSPLDEAMAALPGIRTLRFMDDWIILAPNRWKRRAAVRVMNQVLEGLGLAQHPDKTFIGRLERGFDFLGVQFTACGELSPSAVSRARHTEKTARLYEQGASAERIGRYQQHWQRALRGLLGSAPPDPAPPPAPPIPPRPPAPMPELAPSPRYPFPRQHRLLERIMQKNRVTLYDETTAKTKQARVLPHRRPRRRSRRHLR